MCAHGQASNDATYQLDLASMGVDEAVYLPVSSWCLGDRCTDAFVVRDQRCDEVCNDVPEESCRFRPGSGGEVGACMPVDAADAIFGATVGDNPEAEPLGVGSGASLHPTIHPTTQPIGGSLSRDEIRRVIGRQLHEVRSCYEQALRHQPGLEGLVVVRFTIAQNGSVEASSVASERTTLADESVSRCIADVVARLTFPPPDGGLVRVVYPFRLNTRSFGAGSSGTPAGPNASTPSNALDSHKTAGHLI